MLDNEFHRNFRTLYKLWHHCKLLILIIFTTILFTVASIVLAIGGEIDITWGVKHPAFASFLLNEQAYDEDEDD